MVVILFIFKVIGLEIKNILDLDLINVFFDFKFEIKVILFFVNMDFLINKILNDLFRNFKVLVVGGVVKSFLFNDVKKKLV